MFKMFLSADHSPVQENHVSDQTAISSEEVSGEEVDNPSENGDGTIEEEEAPVPEVVDAIPDDTHVAAESDSKVEEVPKKSYASIVSSLVQTTLNFLLDACDCLASVISFFVISTSMWWFKVNEGVGKNGFSCCILSPI